ncbi:hypothetical protein DAA51_35625 [Bradyrhizobium sp. WBAH10]|nr:hypothetical protein [Bradyrhizobium sp. WBAH30]MDD1545862.1 hypothetical protein [Bradyrhizobium sp. WBAH41]MDD1559184.1 hypothetical protein [Bradyrhizobium sp. WBAH23]MDD1566284.1 hypothetical protein [Bradyrhizobium sp. WBAH33]MDD1591750.1 hypothetical protein [Bradyrhizobium sp. WBAH42]NRB89957.1 hypothetical protein [Bradyrhizobium sp. WBAH10]QCJ93223.1 hypothetical protein DAA57_35870 [Bradyrhizobium yuanmingense]
MGPGSAQQRFTLQRVRDMRASDAGGARPRHCERSEAIQVVSGAGFWIASAFAKASADNSLRSQ